MRLRVPERRTFLLKRFDRPSADGLWVTEKQGFDLMCLHGVIRFSLSWFVAVVIGHAIPSKCMYIAILHDSAVET
jgi:hypothetical protein